MNETVKKQKRLQVNVSPELAEQSQNIFQKLGLITQDALTIFFFQQVVATKEIPFDIQMTAEQKSTMNLRDAVSKLPVQKLRTKQDVADWLNEEDADYE